MTFTTCFSYISVVHFSPIQSYSTHSGFIQFTLVLFSPIQFTLVLFNPFNPLWFYSVHFCVFFQLTLVLFGPFRPLQSYSVHFIRFDQLQSYLVHFSSIQSILYSVLFGLIWSYTVHFGSIRPILILFSSH